MPRSGSSATSPISAGAVLSGPRLRALALSGLAALVVGSVAFPSRVERARGTPIERENARAGTVSWKLPQAPPRAIEGYASEVSVLPGDMLRLHVSTTPPASYRVELYRLGWYGGAGGRLVGCVPGCRSARGGASFPVRPPDRSTGFLQADWPVTDSLRVGEHWVSGYYLADFVLTGGPSTGRGGWFPFVVRAPAIRPAAMLVVVPVNTWQAYNSWGGRSLYWNHSGIGDDHVSFARPYDPAGLPTAGGPSPANANVPQTWELPLARFLERRGYDVSYTTDVDVDRDPSELARHRLVLTAGHSEYWTTTMRDAFEQARELGTNLAFMGANTGYWQMRYADRRRTIVEYRDGGRDPEPSLALKTVRFRDLVPSRPECQLLGVQFGEIGDGDYSVAAGASGDPWLAGTGFRPSSTLRGLVGYEYDSITDGCRVPRVTGLFHFSIPNHANADAVRYVAPSGARVFSSGSFRFSWGLDAGTGYGDRRLRRFMRNALADLGRPAAPVAVRAVALPAVSGVRIEVESHADPHVRAIVVFRYRPEFPLSRAVPICATSTGSCVDRAPGSGVLVYEAVAVDRWGWSAPARSAPVRVGR